MRCAHCLLIVALSSIALCAQNNATPTDGTQGSGPSSNASTAPQTSPSDSTALEVVSRIQPAYPFDAAGHKLAGQVLLKILVSETGLVESTETVSGDPMLAAV